ncbi:MAG: hypothetical protein ACOX5M_02130 [Bacillota bacterium]
MEREVRREREDGFWRYTSDEVDVTDSWLQIRTDPLRLLFTIPGPIPTVNLELKHYLPGDRYVSATLRKWWNGQIAGAIRGRCPKLKTAGVIVQLGTRADLDNIGLKCLVNALVHNGILPSDKIRVLRFLAVEHIKTDEPEVRVCVFEPDEEFERALTILRSKTELGPEPVAERVRPQPGDFFFDPKS